MRCGIAPSSRLEIASSSGRQTASMIVYRAPTLAPRPPRAYTKAVRTALLLLAAAASWAGTPDAPVSVDGVSCAPCRDAEELRGLLALVPAHLKEAIPAARRWFADNPAADGETRWGPNCHWASLSFADAARARRPAFVNFDAFEPALAAGYRRLGDEESPRLGDLVVFEHRYRERHVDPEGGPGGRPLVAWTEVVRPLHTAVVLSGARLFQKETPHDDAFSVDAPEAVLARWREYAGRGSALRRGTVSPLYYRSR